MTLKGFSQTVTQDTTGISLPGTVAKEVVKDLILGDRAKEEVKVLEEMVLLQSKKNAILDSLNQVLYNRIGNYVKIIDIKDKQFETVTKLNNVLEDSLKTQRRKTSFYKVTTVMGVTASLIFLIL